jgi:hypothetical protein
MKMSLSGGVALVAGAWGYRPQHGEAHSAPPPANISEKCQYVTEKGAIGRIAAEISLRGRLAVLVLSSGIYERSGEPALVAAHTLLPISRLNFPRVAHGSYGQKLVTA